MAGCHPQPRCVLTPTTTPPGPTGSNCLICPGKCGWRCQDPSAATPWVWPSCREERGRAGFVLRESDPIPVSAAPRKHHPPQPLGPPG